MSGELSEFEQKSTMVPKGMPYAIIGGVILALIMLALISMFGKNEAVQDIHKKAAATSAAATAPAGGAVDDI